jgi:hypothetical protein
MSECPLCRERFSPDNPASKTVALQDAGGEPVWIPVCRLCAEELEASESATRQQ